MLRSGGAAARRALEVIVVFGPLLFTVGAFHVWWGGTASPGRPVASGVLLLGAADRVVLRSHEATRPSVRAGCQVLLAASLAIACALASRRAAPCSTTIATGAPRSSIGCRRRGRCGPRCRASSPGPSPARSDARSRGWRWGAAAAWLVHRFRPHEFGAAALAPARCWDRPARSRIVSLAAAAASAATPGPETRAPRPAPGRLRRRPASDDDPLRSAVAPHDRRRRCRA